jgi:hypothetical protein
MKTALITGGAQGIGRGIVQRLRADGWRVALFDLDNEAVAEMRAEDPDLLALPIRITDPWKICPWPIGSGCWTVM